jgi:UDP-3-O-[3-hydroxymyristoyl] glucosamine N-acyltransferase
MPDPRFHRRAGPFPLRALAELIGADRVGDYDTDLLIYDVGSIENADARSISVFMDPRLRAALARTKAAAIVTTAEHRHIVRSTLNLLLVPQPRMAFALIEQLFYPEPSLEGWISPQATINPSASIGAGCRIEPGAVIEAHARIGPACMIGANTVIGAAVSLGESCRIGANVTLSHAMLGDRVQVFANVAIGQPGFGFVESPLGYFRVPQLGRVLIGDDVEIGSGCTIDRGALGDTRIGAKCKIDSGVKIAHNVTLGHSCILAGHVGIAGSTTLGDYVVVGGGVVISDHVTIGNGARMAIGSCVIRDVAPGTAVGGYPAVAARHWHRQTVEIGRLSKLRKQETRRREAGDRRIID